MKKSIFTIVLVVASLILFSINAIAAGPYEPYLNYSGQFTYTNSSNKLTFANTAFSEVTYLGGSSETYSVSPLDPILGASIYIGDLFNSAANSTHFDNGSGGGVTFEIKDGTYTYLTATLTAMDFVFPVGPFAPVALSNIPLTTYNLTHMSYGSGFSSQYITELMNIDVPGMQFSSSFSFNPPSFPPYNFVSNSNGTMMGIVSAPEPISTALFLAGGLTIGLRHFVRRKKIVS